MLEPRLRYPIVVSFLAAVLTLTLKWFAYALTGSVGILSDATESFANVLTALTAFFSLWYSARPVDPSHTYGHEKIEYFSSGLEGSLIIAASVWMGWYAVKRLFVPEAIEQLDWGVAIGFVASIVNLATAQILLRAGRKHRSIVLEADGRHLMADVVTSWAVVAALVLVRTTNWLLLDPLIGLTVAVYISWTGIDLVRSSFNGLMDHSLPEAEQSVLRAAIERQLEPGMDYHALRTRQAGSRKFVDFHLLVPGSSSVRRAHEMTGVVEEAVRSALPGAEVTVHIEPIEEPAAWQDSELLALEQAIERERLTKESGPPK